MLRKPSSYIRVIGSSPRYSAADPTASDGSSTWASVTPAGDADGVLAAGPPPGPATAV